MTNEEIKNIPEVVDLVLDESITADARVKLHKRLEEVCELAIQVLEQQPCEDTEVIKVSKGAVKARQGRFVIYDVDWLKKNFYSTEEKIYGQPKQPCEDVVKCNFTTEEIAKSFIEDVEAVKDQLDGQPCEDCISREAVIDIIDFEDKWLFDAKSHNADTHIAFSGLESRVKALPSVTPQRPKRQWIIKGDKEQGYDIAGIKTWYIQIMCDKCGFIKTAIEGHTGQYHYCPNCGADMGGGEDEASD